MNIHLFTYQVNGLHESSSLISKVDAIVSYCKKNKISKVMVERPDIISTKSRAPKAVIHVNIDSVVRMLTVRGTTAVPFKNVTQYPVINAQTWIENMEKQTITIIEQNKFNTENILVISSTINISASHIPVTDSKLKQHASDNNWTLNYCNFE